MEKISENEECMLNSLVCGDIHSNVLGIEMQFNFCVFQLDNIFLEHFCLWVDEVIGPILRQAENIQKFPLCISKGMINRL